MAIRSEDYTFEGNTYFIGKRKDRVTAALAHNGGYKRVIEAKDADYTILESDLGKVFTNRGASGTITITLPDPASGVWNGTLDVVCVVGQKITIATAVADTLIVSGDAEADTIAHSATAAANIGTMYRIFCDGTSWICVSLGNAAGATTAHNYTVVTA